MIKQDYNNAITVHRDIHRVGTGIGLPLTRRLVELHGGSVDVHSKPGEGSTFWFTLPKEKIAAGVTGVSAKNTEAAFQNGSKARILVAEENEVNLSLITDMLSVQGHDVKIAKNGKEAVDLAKSFNPELILMDIRMPVMDGLEATQHLRSMSDFVHTPIIALTASTGSEAEDRQVLAGCTEHLSKPIQSKQLFAVLQKHLGVKTVTSNKL